MVMIHTDIFYARPTVFKLTTSLRDKYIQLDMYGDASEVLSVSGRLANTYMNVVSYVSNDAAVYETIEWED